MSESRRRFSAKKNTFRAIPDGWGFRPGLRASALATLALLAGVASAEAGSGGVGSAGGPSAGSGTAQSAGTGACPATQLGSRRLAVGDCGDDVATLNWILKSKQYPKVSLVDQFATGTESALERFQSTAGLPTDGVFARRTHRALAKSMPSQIATYYGPGLYGNRTACGQTLTTRTVGVAHKKLPCGSKVVVRYKGRYLRTKVIDRGPYANNAKWDLTQRAADRLGFDSTGRVRVAKIAKRG